MKSFLASLATLLIALAGSASGNTGANVQCWAPGMTAPITLNSHGQGIGVYCGRPENYVIYGVAGSITLGNQCDGAFPDPNSSDNRFRQGWWIGGLGAHTNISSHVKLQVNWAQYYPKRVEVTGDRPGVSSGPVRLYGETWETAKKFGYRETTVVFHLAGSQDYAIPNRNPSGFFYVVGEINPTAGEPTGKLTIDSNYLLRGNITPVGYSITRGSSTKGQTPPFTAYNPGNEVVFAKTN
ncbi:MAG: hypothetical protein KF712_09620 [Akkermansiaceae bacterium]|nr:hypothetical protein [Akkermansiaceae bacterium]